jgi:DMSO/TMAO reductase YedYZ molybdopterin-dependent catalytic subunit
VDTLPEEVDTAAEYVTAWCDGGYTTNLALEDVTGGKAWVVHEYDGEPLDAEHGGPARLLVPHLYFWKSAKWVRGLALTLGDEPGFWETYGYHNHGDPWLEHRRDRGLAEADRVRMARPRHEQVDREQDEDQADRRCPAGEGHAKHKRFLPVPAAD